MILMSLSTSLAHAGDWLNVLPSPSLGLTLHNQDFRHCLDYWLGLRLVNERMTCAICNKFDAADSLWDHQIGCGGNGDLIHRHDALCDALFSAAQSAALGPRKEVPALIAGSRSRPADIFLPNWCGGRPATLDVTVIPPLQSLTLAGTASVKGHALQVAEDRKRAAHNANCAAAGVVFLPIAVETLGGWSEEAVFHIPKISRLRGSGRGFLQMRPETSFSKNSYLPVEGECHCFGLTDFLHLQHGWMETFNSILFSP